MIRTLSALFFVSGAGALVFEVAAMKAFSAGLGSSVYASTLTIAAYMAGLALGSRALGRRVDGHPDPLLLYAHLELAVAASGLLVPAVAAVLHGTGPLGIFGLVAGSPTALLLAKGALVFGSLLVPTFLMGGTLPVLVRALLDHDPRAEAALTQLYALNALGASLGALVAGFWLLPYSGVRVTLLLALGLYAAVGGLARELARKAREGEEADDDAEVAAAPGGGEGGAAEARLEVGTAAIVLGCTGFLLLALEHAWFRYFSLVLDSSTYSFSVVLSAVILGIGLGSLAARLVFRARPAARADVGYALLLYALALGLGIPLLDDLPYAYMRARLALGLDWGAVMALKYATALAVMLVPAACSGFVFPAVLALAVDPEEDPGARVGAVAAWNTVGSVLGIVASTFLLVPALGLKGTMVAGAFGVLAIALPFLRAGAAPGRVAGVLVACVLVLAARSPWEWRRIGSALYRDVRPGGEVSLEQRWREVGAGDVETLMLRHGTLASVSVEQEPSGHRVLRINGKADASSGEDMATQRLLAHVPLLLHPKPEEVLVIGLGSGVTAAAARHHGPTRLDVVEIEPAVVEGARLFAEVNGGVLDDPGVGLHVEDAKAFLERAARPYDVVISEPTNPWIAGIASLFTVEFFRTVHAHLKPGGVALQWFHLYETDLLAVSVILRSFLEVFPEARLFLMGPRDVAVVGARDGPLRPDLAVMAARMARPGLREDLEAVGITRPEVLLGANLLGPGSLRAFGAVPVAPLNTEDLPILEYEAPRGFFAGGEVPVPALAPDGLFWSLPEEARGPRVLRDLALFHVRNQGDQEKARAWLADAVKRNPRDLVAHQARARSLERAGHPAAAGEHLLVAASEGVEALRELALLLARTDRRLYGPRWSTVARKARALLRESHAREELGRVGTLRWARLAFAAGDPGEAVVAYRALLATHGPAPVEGVSPVRALEDLRALAPRLAAEAAALRAAGLAEAAFEAETRARDLARALAN